MKSASVRDLKNRTSEILRRAAREEVLITSRGRPVACLVGITEEDLTLRPAAARRAKEGMVRLLARIWKIRPDKGKKWISQERHDRVLYGSSNE